ncbi:hypothetical protein O6H91_07G085800 [Diphasiastrum complanatum]|uniref:Uncharacterized protein n=3 Tax=Diphasiastrum complanatum TaxID=34168 RepID=A0ACC2D7K8_DIPCM|nr:hypothetical protein O6H91_07G068000 [Diphasiastrum complanatum]KAJ7550159.1 hypothetical protein O6H91_07G085800 [Diphasiastrum complanatum]KAJ7550160.1 hypothetical protein O6H91_07G085800 [Diphasiastrum complanatum]
MPDSVSTMFSCSDDEGHSGIVPVPWILKKSPKSEHRASFMLAFKNLTYTVRVSQISKIPVFSSLTRLFHPGSGPRISLLTDVSGEIRDGEMMAVMGPSGSGKSTLIDAIAGRIHKQRLKGETTLNGQELKGGIFRKISAYVMQDDLLFPMLTVEETLMFSAQIRLRSELSYARKRARVNKLLLQLGLEKVAGTIIGDEGHRGISGGERRRVSIGVDIMHDPLLLFLDEPTSGLDSTSAHMVIETLKKIARAGSIVLLTIHQPSYRILRLFDGLIFLADGQMIYSGPPLLLKTFFQEFGTPIPAHEDPTEFTLDIIQKLRSEPGGILFLVGFLKNRWSQIYHEKLDRYRGRSRNHLPTSVHDLEKSIAMRMNRCQVIDDESYEIQHEQAEETPSNQCDDMLQKFANPWWREIYVLTWRGLLNIRRTPELFLTRLITMVVAAFLLATVFYHSDHTPQGLQERLGFLAFAVSTTFYSCIDCLPTFLQERYIFTRETAHNAYRKSAYVVANTIIYIPFLGILSIAFTCTIWWLVGLSGNGHNLLFFFLIIWASFWTGNSFATLLSAVISNVIVGFTVVIALLAYFLLLSGFFIGRDRIPHYWLWFHYISIIKYPYDAILINEFGNGGRSSCYERGSQIFHGTPLAGQFDSTTLDSMFYNLSGILLGSPTTNFNSSTCIVSGRAVLENLHITPNGKWTCLLITVAMGLFFRILFYVILRFNGHHVKH